VQHEHLDAGILVTRMHLVLCLACTKGHLCSKEMNPIPVAVRVPGAVREARHRQGGEVLGAGAGGICGAAAGGRAVDAAARVPGVGTGLGSTLQALGVCFLGRGDAAFHSYVVRFRVACGIAAVLLLLLGRLPRSCFICGCAHGLSRRGGWPMCKMNALST
jgi:hypothetical protein